MHSTTNPRIRPEASDPTAILSLQGGGRDGCSGSGLNRGSYLSSGDVVGVNVVKLKPKVKCGAIGCTKKVYKGNTDKRVLCKPCWHKKIEEAALTPNHMMHIAHSDNQHEFIVINELEDFIKWHDIEREVET